MIARTCVLYLIIIIKSEVWSIYHYLRLCHETRVCAVCLSMILSVAKSYPKTTLNYWQLQTNYLIIIVNRITYSNNRITKNKSRIPLDLYIKLGPYKFSLQASVDHHGYSMNSGHYTASINCCGKTFHCNDNKITECNITDTYNSSTAYILLYKLMLC